MRNIKFHIILLVAAALTLFSCNKKEHVYDSTGTTKTKKTGSSIGKYNKLLKSSDMVAKYNAAVKYFEKEDYTRALGLFEELMSVYRGTSKGEEVHYYYAYCNYNLSDFIVAGYQFRSFVKSFPNSKHAEECSYLNAYCYYLNSPKFSLDQTDTKFAIKEFQRFANQYPQSTRIPECNDILDVLRAKLESKSYENAMLYYKMSEYKAVVVAFENFIKDFPGSKHVEELNYLIIRSYYLLAINSIESKKQERFKSVVDHYLKFIDKYPQSRYIEQAEMVYSNALKNLEKYSNNQTL